MLINEKEVIGETVAYDGCHKLYVCEDETDIRDAQEIGYEIHSILELPYLYGSSCSLRFINNWKLDKTYCGQFEEANFSY